MGFLRLAFLSFISPWAAVSHTYIMWLYGQVTQSQPFAFQRRDLPMSLLKRDQGLHVLILSADNGNILVITNELLISWTVWFTYSVIWVLCACSVYIILLESHVGPHHWQKRRWWDVAYFCPSTPSIISKKLQNEVYIKRHAILSWNKSAYTEKTFWLFFNLHFRVFCCPPLRGQSYLRARAFVFAA